MKRSAQPFVNGERRSRGIRVFSGPVGTRRNIVLERLTQLGEGKKVLINGGDAALASYIRKRS